MSFESNKKRKHGSDAPRRIDSRNDERNDDAVVAAVGAAADDDAVGAASSLADADATTSAVGNNNTNNNDAKKRKHERHNDGKGSKHSNKTDNDNDNNDDGDTGASAAAAAAAAAEEKLNNKARKALKKQLKQQQAAERAAAGLHNDDGNNNNDDDDDRKKFKKHSKKSKKAGEATNDDTAYAPKEWAAADVSTSASVKTELSITYDPASAASEFPAFTSFEPLKQLIPKWMFKAACGSFEAPTPVQAHTWPLAFAGREVIGVARTGSGKTLSFALPALARCIAAPQAPAPRKPLVLVLAPTRELASQISVVVEGAVSGAPSADAAKIGVTCVYGGVDKKPQRASLQTAAFVVATPGRLLDLCEEGSVDLSSVCVFVLDEADRMLDMGFEKEMRAIAAKVTGGGARHADVQTLMFSATWPMIVRKLAADYLRPAPIRLSILAQSHREGENPEDATGPMAADSVTQHVRVLEAPGAKDTELLALVDRVKRDGRCIVFCLYKKEAARVEQLLNRRGHACVSLHGDKSQAERNKAFEAFRSGESHLLVATDVAARGVDIPDVANVINYTFPLTIEDYVHRIGRTGRAGKRGTSYTFFTNDDKAHAGALVNVLQRANQTVPPEMMKFSLTTKKKEDGLYGAFGPKASLAGLKSTRIVFDD